MEWTNLLAWIWCSSMCSKYQARCIRHRHALLLSFIIIFSDPCMVLSRPEGKAVSRRWYTAKDDIRKASCMGPFHHYGSFGSMGLDGGLCCQFTPTKIAETKVYDQIWRQIIVYNPIAKTVKKLPIVPDRWTFDAYPTLCMVVDSISQGLKIFLIYDDFGRESLRDRSLMLNDPFMLVYDSVTNKWRSSANPSGMQNLVVPQTSCVMFQGHLYIYLRSLGETKHSLWRYDLLKDTWEKLTVDVPTELTFNPKLIVSVNRLFLVAWSAEWVYRNSAGSVIDLGDNAWCFEVSEIKIPAVIRETTFELSKESMMSLFDMKTGVERGCDLPVVSVWFWQLTHAHFQLIWKLDCI